MVAFVPKSLFTFCAFFLWSSLLFSQNHSLTVNQPAVNGNSVNAKLVPSSAGLWHVQHGKITNDENIVTNSHYPFIQLQKGGFISSSFLLTGEEDLITFVHVPLANSQDVAWAFYHSIDSGRTWIKHSNTHTHTALYSKDHFTINHQVPVWIKIQNEGKESFVLGNIKVKTLKKASNNPNNVGTTSLRNGGNPVSLGTTCSCTTFNPSDTLPTRDNNMAMGNPSNSTANTTDSNNFLITKNQYTLSYNNKLGVPNWVSWHLSSAWKGSATRCNCFKIDTALPTGYNKVSTSVYTNTGFDRGHICPSDDRDSTTSDNEATFYMTNITPQAPILNQQTWGDLEDYCRKLITQSQELYIIAGGYGSGGTGSLGGITSTINSGKVNVYSHFWKIIVVLPIGINDVSRISNATRIIAVDMPNLQSVNSNSWDKYRVSVDSIEAATGYNFLSNVSTTIQSVIEATVDTTTIN